MSSVNDPADPTVVAVLPGARVVADTVESDEGEPVDPIEVDVAPGTT